MAEALLLPGVTMHRAKWRERERVKTKLGITVTVRCTLVTTSEQLEAMASVLRAFPRIVCDVETSGRNPHLGAQIVGYAFAVRPSPEAVYCWYVPVRHRGPHISDGAEKPITQLPEDVVRRAVNDVLGMSGEVGMHNGKFDRWHLRKEGVKLLRKILDTAVRATTANENEKSFALKNLAAKYLIEDAKAEKDEVEDFLKRDAHALGLTFRDRRRNEEDANEESSYLDRFGHSRTPILLEGMYACHDVLYTVLLLDMYEPTVHAFPEVSEREYHTGEALHEMEWRGLPLDTEEVRRAQVTAQNEVDYYEQQVRRLVPESFAEINDTTLRELFFSTWKMKPPKLTDAGERAQRAARDAGEDFTPLPKHCAVDKEAREILGWQYPQHRPALLAIGGHARAKKIATTYTSAFLRYYSPETGCLHPVYNQLEEREAGGVPVTGRLSSADPNIQNVAKKPVHLAACGCKKCLKARADGEIFDSGVPAGPEYTLSVRRYFPVRPGYVRAYIDFSQIELRVLAWLCRDPTLLHCYAHDIDVHEITAKEVTGGDRDVAKQVNFGNSYGMTEIGLAKRMKGYAKDPEGTRAKAKVYLEAFFRKYAGIPAFRRALATQMEKQGCMFVSPFGRPRRIVEIGAKERWIRERGERMMMSSIVSGTSADLMKEVLIRARHWLSQACPDAWIIQSIHDELVYEVPERYAAPLLHGVMQITTKWPMFEIGGVPIKAGCSITTSTWEQKKEAVLEPTAWRYAA